jgi:hypothetical protein
MLAKMYKIGNIKAPLAKYIVWLPSYMVQNPKHLVEYLNYCAWLQNAPRCSLGLWFFIFDMLSSILK